jgi:hypothetical protein
MGQELGALYSALWQEHSWLHAKWHEFVVLFGTKPERIDLLNQAAPAFFRQVQDMFWEEIVLHIARLLDSPVSVGKPNLSFRRLPLCIDAPDLKHDVDSLVKACLDKGKFAKDWRNRHLAHRDLERAIGETPEPLAFASRQAVNEVMASMDAVLDAISQHYRGSETVFDFVAPHGGAEDLLYLLRDGLKYRDEKRKRIESGDMREGDFDRTPL